MTDGVMLAPGGGRRITGGGMDATLKVPTNHPSFASTFEVIVPPGFDVGAELARSTPPPSSTGAMRNGSSSATSTPGFERTNPWTLNLRAHPLVRVQIGREVRIYLAREATEEELGRYWPRLVEICQRTRHATTEADNVSSSCSNPTLGEENDRTQSCHRRWAARPSRTSFS
jgi:hypothetical protein